MTDQPAYLEKAAALALCPSDPAGNALKEALAGLSERDYLFGLDEVEGYPFAVLRELVEGERG